MSAADDLEEMMALEYALAEKDLGHYIQAAWEVLEPETPLKWNWHHDLICEYLTACRRGQIRRLIINIAPRSTKSILATIGFPTWLWTTLPSKRFLFGSYADSLATKHSVLRRDIIESPWYQQGWCDRYRLASDVNTKSEFVNNKTGLMKAAGLKGSVTGEGGDFIIIDDPHNPKGVESDQEREQTIQNFDLAWSTRLNDKKTGCIIVIMQRLHHLDMTGHLLEKGYEHLKIPSEAEERTVVHFPISHRELVREPGELMHPERDGPEELAVAKIDLGSYGYAGQHQQSPTPREGAIINGEWFKQYGAIPARFDQVIQSWDFAVKGKELNDYTVGLVLGRIGARKYVLDMVRGRMNFPQACQALIRLSMKWPQAHRKVIEAKANGPAVIAQLEDQVPGLIEIEPDGDKAARLNAVSPTVEAGNVWLPDPVKVSAPWLHDFITEVCQFPASAHDDIVDTFSQGIRELNKPGVVYAPSSGHSGSIHQSR